MKTKWNRYRIVVILFYGVRFVPALIIVVSILWLSDVLFSHILLRIVFVFTMCAIFQHVLKLVFNSKWFEKTSENVCENLDNWIDEDDY